MVLDGEDYGKSRRKSKTLKKIYALIDTVTTVSALFGLILLRPWFSPTLQVNYEIPRGVLTLRDDEYFLQISLVVFILTAEFTFFFLHTNKYTSLPPAGYELNCSKLNLKIIRD